VAVACAARQMPAPIEYLLRKAGLGQEESMPSSGRLNFMSQLPSGAEQPWLTVKCQRAATQSNHPIEKQIANSKPAT